MLFKFRASCHHQDRGDNISCRVETNFSALAAMARGLRGSFELKKCRDGDGDDGDATQVQLAHHFRLPVEKFKTQQLV